MMPAPVLRDDDTRCRDSERAAARCLREAAQLTSVRDGYVRRFDDTPRERRYGAPACLMLRAYYACYAR